MEKFINKFLNKIKLTINDQLTKDLPDALQQLT